jgi:hypothetical protein
MACASTGLTVVGIGNWVYYGQMLGLVIALCYRPNIIIGARDACCENRAIRNGRGALRPCPVRVYTLRKLAW